MVYGLWCQARMSFKEMIDHQDEIIFHRDEGKGAGIVNILPDPNSHDINLLAFD